MRNAQFDDIYFSAEGGLAESRHVFLAGNTLPNRWTGRDRFAILELGLGTGLNMLATWQLWQRTAKPDQHLDYHAIEKYPLTRAQLREALTPFAAELGTLTNQLLDVYPLDEDLTGCVAISLGNLSLHLYCIDVMATLPHLTARFDAFYLDGFAPAKNPDMWSPELLIALGLLARPGATVATFTVARAVRDGLAAAGFTVAKQPGFGRKRDMLAGIFN